MITTHGGLQYSVVVSDDEYLFTTIRIETAIKAKTITRTTGTKITTKKQPHFFYCDFFVISLILNLI